MSEKSLTPMEKADIEMATWTVKVLKTYPVEKVDVELYCQTVERLLEILENRGFSLISNSHF